MIDAHPCPCCSLEWETNCEQHVCMQLFGECIVCRFMPDGKGSRSGSLADMDRITARRRELIAASITSVEEDGDTMTINSMLPSAAGVTPCGELAGLPQEIDRPSGSDWVAVGGFRYDRHAGWQQVAAEYANDPDVTTLYRKRANGVGGGYVQTFCTQDANASPGGGE